MGRLGGKPRHGKGLAHEVSRLVPRILEDTDRRVDSDGRGSKGLDRVCQAEVLPRGFKQRNNKCTHLICIQDLGWGSSVLMRFVFLFSIFKIN